MSFTIREHTADVAIEAVGETLGDVFVAIADGLAAAQCDDIPMSGDRFSFEVRAESREALLFDVLDRIIYERDVRGLLPIDHTIEITEDNTEWVGLVIARGVPVEEIEAREIKAVTYSEMKLECVNSNWYAYVVFDV